MNDNDQRKETLSEFRDIMDQNHPEDSGAPDTSDESMQEASKSGCPKCCCAQKTTMRSDEEYKKLINRLNRIEGQIRGIKGMLEKNAYCTDILTQSAAVSAAVNSFNKELLASHIRSCVVRDIREGNDEVIDELVTTLQKLMK
jgi:DNA-binding FrmR family transcriptional regulator